MFYYTCEVCGEKFNLLTLDSSGENEYYVMCKCSKCGTKYKAPKINKKKIYILMIPLGVACIPEYILLRKYFDLNSFFSQVIVIGVFYLGCDYRHKSC